MFDKKKRKKEIYVETKSGDRKAVLAVVALALSLILFIILTMIQNKIVHSVEKTNVVVVQAEVPRGVIITESNLHTYFTEKLRVAEDLPRNAVITAETLLGRSTARKLTKNETVLYDDFVNESYLEGIEDPVEISIDVTQIGQAVGGILRAGDLIDAKAVVDISTVAAFLTDEKKSEILSEDSPLVSFDYEEDSMTGQGQDEETNKQEPDSDEELYMEGAVVIDPLQEAADNEEKSTDVFGKLKDHSKSVTGRYVIVDVLENARVVNVFTSAGLNTEQTTSTDGAEQVATIINVVIPKQQEKLVMLALEEGTLRIAKVLGGVDAGQEETDGVE